MEAAATTWLSRAADGERTDERSRHGTGSARPGLRTMARGRAREVREDAAGAVGEACKRFHTVRSQLWKKRRASSSRGCAAGDRMARSEPLLSASEQAAMAKNEPLLTATEQACSCKAGSCPRKADNCGDFLRRSHPDYPGQRSPLEYCVSEFR